MKEIKNATATATTVEEKVNATVEEKVNATVIEIEEKVNAYARATALTPVDLKALTLIKDRNDSRYDSILDDIATKLDKARAEADDEKREAIEKEVRDLKAEVLKKSRARFIENTTNLAKHNLLPVRLIRALYPMMTTARWTLSDGTYCACTDGRDFVDIDTILNGIPKDDITQAHCDLEKLKGTIEERVQNQINRESGMVSSNNTVKKTISDWIVKYITPGIDEKFIVATADIMQLERLFTETKKLDVSVFRAVTAEKFEYQFVRILYRIITKSDYTREESKKK